MPLHVDGIAPGTTKGALLRWLLDSGEVRKPQVGAIALQGRHAIIEVPEQAGPRLARHLEAKPFGSRTVQVWFDSPDEGTDQDEHFQKLSRWLDLEEHAETQEAETRSGRPADRDTSTALVNLVLRGEETGLGGHAFLTLSRPDPNLPLPVTQLAVGAPVRLSEHPPQPGRSQRGVLTRLGRKQVEIALSSSPFPLQGEVRFRIDAAEDTVALQRCRAALAKARHARGDRLAELRDILLGHSLPGFDAPATLARIDPNLNDSQEAAIAFALAARDVAVIHGPPGTGKTTTVVELIRQSIRAGGKVLACAPSNLGVDNLFERLLAAGEKVVRLGHVARVLPRLREHTLAALAPAHPQAKRVKQLRTEAARLFRDADRDTRAPRSRDDRRALREEAKSLLDEARRQESGIVQEIIDEATVLCATNTGLDADLLGSRRFDLAIIDEACQCPEPACWIPVLRADRIVLAGDHCQLPPTILSQQAAREGFAVSLQERLLQCHGEELARLLTVQYRMHRDIMRHSSATFYHGRLEAHPSVAGHLLRDLPGTGDSELTGTAIHFIDTSGAGHEEEKEAGGNSLLNREEAALALRKVRELLQAGVPAGAIGLITPYTAQARLLRDQLDLEEVEVGSIDSFQGREKEAIVLSLVRCNPQHDIGFLADTRRMNVALTRARRKLLVIGESATIAHHPFYQSLLDHFDAVGAYHGVWEEA